MKKLIINFILFNTILFNSYHLFSQENRMPSFERMKAMKMTFISEKIPFSNQDEIYFWEVFGKYENLLYKDIWESRNEYMKNRDKKDFNSYDEIQAKEILNKWTNWEERQNKLWIERKNELLEKFSYSIVLNILNLEEKFWRNRILNRNFSAKKKIN
ncbi:MAG: hypothetical protein CMC33_03100 [Flavobacteriaceae bacterium]|nr:hypothetical protein [Flavobacteriaceae bacterium]